MYVQNYIFLSFLKNEKIISSFFDIAYLCRYHLFLYLRRKASNLEIVNYFTRQKKFHYVTRSITYNDAVV